MKMMTLNKFNALLFFTAFIFGITSYAMDVVPAIDENQQNELNKQFLNAPMSYHLDIMEGLIKRGADINTKDDGGWTRLHVAAKFNYFNACKLLLENKADVNPETHTYGETPLMCAAGFGNKKICKLLIQHGAEVNKRSHENTTALKRAAHRGNTYICELLVEHNADINVQDKWGWNGLMYATRDGAKNVCKFLVEHNAQLNLVNEDGDTALMIAAASIGSFDHLDKRVKQCRMLTQSMIEGNIDARTSALTFLGIKRKRNVSLLQKNMPYDVAKLVAKKILAIDRRHKPNLFAQIDMIQDQTVKKYLQSFAQELLAIENSNLSREQKNQTIVAKYECSDNFFWDLYIIKNRLLYL